MAAISLPFATPLEKAELRLCRFAAFSGLRVLAWRDDVLYASRGYTLLRATITAASRRVEWEPVGEARPQWWRKLMSTSRLSARLCRDGFHALAILPSGEVIAAVPHAIGTLSHGEREFRTTHRVLRGIRPLHFAVTSHGHIFWGEYFDNRERDEVHIYGSSDHGAHWDVAYTFPRGSIRHVHNIVYDEWENCLWGLTGDDGSECRIIRAACDFSDVEVVLSGRQQARCVALIPAHDALYFSSDTPLEQNHVYRLERRGNLSEVAKLSSSSICGCRVGGNFFFSTMVEPSEVNSERNVCLYGSPDGLQFTRLVNWEKDSWPMSVFQYGNAFLPDGNNCSCVLAVTTVAVKAADCVTTLWQVSN
jgi:hypothetical protein